MELTLLLTLCSLASAKTHRGGLCTQRTSPWRSPSYSFPFSA